MFTNERREIEQMVDCLLTEGVLELLPEIPDDYGEFTFDDMDRRNIRKAIEANLIPNELPSNEYIATATVHVLRDAYADSDIPSDEEEAKQYVRWWVKGKDRADLAAWFIVTVLAPIAARLSVEGKL